MRHPSIVSAVAMVVIVGSAGCGASAHTRLAVEPRSATFDVPFTISASGFAAKRPATVTFTGVSPSRTRWRGRLLSHTDSHGYLRLDDEYLYARMHAVNGSIGSWPEDVTITVRVGGEVAATHATRSQRAADPYTTTDERPAEVGFYGEWLTPKHADHHTAILLFGGSEGGLYFRPLAATLAGHGYPVLLLAYFREPGLPQSLVRVPLEYFERALKWLRRQPEVAANRVISWGTSRGGEASLLLASTFPTLVRRAVGYVPSAYVYAAPFQPAQPAWTYRGRPVQPKAVIPVWKSGGPVFVVGGGDDKLWPSGRYVAQIAREMRAHGRDDVTALVYQRAGHLLGQAVPSQLPVSPVGYGHIDSIYGPLDLGGSPSADEHGLERSWPRLLRFLAQD
jgi:dienelactone hydrolase